MKFHKISFHEISSRDFRISIVHRQMYMYVVCTQIDMRISLYMYVGLHTYIYRERSGRNSANHGNGPKFIGKIRGKLTEMACIFPVFLRCNGKYGSSPPATSTTSTLLNGTLCEKIRMCFFYGAFDAVGMDLPGRAGLHRRFFVDPRQRCLRSSGMGNKTT